MRCSICNGTLKYINGSYVCENCGTVQSISSFYENTEVFICYIENDIFGRRTKESILTQQLYNKLQIKKINVFYSRISTDGLSDNDYEKVYYEAMNKAKIIVAFGASKENFETLTTRCKNFFDNKKILPVYTGINAYDLPQEYKTLQALNYDNIGADDVLIKLILNELGKEEVDVISTSKLKKRGNKRKITVFLFVVTILIISAVCYIIFGTPYVLKSKKYIYAEKLAENGNFIKAIEMLSSLDNYKNSKNLLNSIYDKYNGYFTNENETLYLHINIDNTLKAEIGIIKVVNGKRIRANASTVFNQNIAEFSYFDSQNINGKGKIILSNNTVELTTKSDQSNDVSIGGINVNFNIKNKENAPISAPLEEKELVSWLVNKTTEQDICQKGYEFETLSDDLGVNNTGIEICNIKNTNIKVLLFPFDVEKVDYDISKYEIAVVNDKIVAGISAPVDIFTSVANEFLSKEYTIIDDLVYVKGQSFSPGIGVGIFLSENNGTEQYVSVVSRNRIFKSNWEKIISEKEQ